LLCDKKRFPLTRFLSTLSSDSDRTSTSLYLDCVPLDPSERRRILSLVRLSVFLLLYSLDLFGFQCCSLTERAILLHLLVPI
jgi:hypothetical protein